MAVTAHWIESTTQDTPHGPQHILTLRADLIGFHRVPGRHDGEHLAHAFLHVLDRVSITWKVVRFIFLFGTHLLNYFFRLVGSHLIMLRITIHFCFTWRNF
jgi:hypothetical protein